MIVARSFARIHETNLKVITEYGTSSLLNMLTMRIETRGFAFMVRRHFRLLEDRIRRHS